MTTFVHIANEKDSSSILHNGLTLPKARLAANETEVYKYGIFALPLVESFLLSHQWVRELKRCGYRTAVGVYFRIPDDTKVWAGHYSQPKLLLTAAQAAAKLRSEAIWGFEVIIPQAITAAEIKHIRKIPQVLGWRYFPAAHGKPPFCGCSYCQRGLIKSRRLQLKYKSLFN